MKKGTKNSGKAAVEATVEVVVAEVAVTKQKGRPVDPNSPRQLKLKEMAEKKADGIEGKKGRPVVEGSPRQLRLAELEAKRLAGELKRGRPVEEGSARQERLAKRASGEAKQGRPTDPTSARQMKLAEIAERKANGTFKLGRPAAVKNEAVAEESAELVEIAAAEGGIE